MSRRGPLLLLPVVAAVAGLAVLLWLALGRDKAGPEPLAVHAAEPAAEAAPAPRAKLELAAGAGEPSRAPGTEDEPDELDLEHALWIAGRVLPPPGAERDPTLAVVALAYVERPEEAPKEASSRAARAHERRKGVGRTRADVAADGTFRVPLRDDATVAYLFVDGRWLFLREPVPVEVAAAPDEVRLEPALGGWLTGSCSVPEAPEEAAELVGEEIGLSSLDSEEGFGGMALRFGAAPQRGAEIRPDLTFEFRGLDPESAYALVARTERFLPAMQSRLKLAAGERRTVELELQLGGRVSGVVLDQDGSPVAGAAVQPVRAGIAEFLGGSGRARTEDDGSFEVFALRPGKVSIKATMDGYADSEPVQLEVAEAERVDGIELRLARGAHIAGRVLWPEGTPAAKARVFVERSGGQAGFNFTRAGRSATTDADGTFSITGLDAEVYNLHATATRGGDQEDEARRAELEGRVADAGPFVNEELRARLMASADLRTGPRWSLRREGVQASAEGLELVLEPPLAIEGRVEDETGAPLSAFRIEARPKRDAMQFLPGVGDVGQGFEDAAGGAFRLEGLETGSWTVTAEADGYAALEEPHAIDLPGGGKDLVFVLTRAARVTGVVQDPTGAPVADADVETGSSGGFRGAGRTDRALRRSAKSDADGRFTLEDVPAASTVVHATAAGWARSEPVPIEPPPGGELTDVVLHLGLGGDLTGEVYGPGGVPLAACRVRYMSMGAGDGGTETTDEAGHFEVQHMTPGIYQVMVEPDPETFLKTVGEDEQPDMARIFEELRMASAEIHEGETTHVVLGQEPKNPVHVEGRVTEAGEPVAGRMVVAMAEGQQVMASMRMAQTDDDGRFRLELKQPGPVLFSVQLAGGANQQFYEDVPEQDSFHVDLELPTGRISGTVYGPDGDPAPGIGVRLSSENGYTPTLVGLSNGSATDEQGRYAFRNVRPGTYTVRAGGSRPFGGGGSFGAQLAAGIVVEDGAARDGIDLHLARSGSVEGRVLDAAGQPANGAAVFVRDAAGRLLSPFTSCLSDALGRFTYDGVAPGSVTVSARLAGEASSESGEVLVHEGEASHVDLQLDAGTILIVSLESESGEAQRVQVRVIDEAGREYASMAAPDQLERSLSSGFSTREHRVGPLPAGRYHVIATTEDGREQKKPVTLRGQEERRLRMRIE
jgi:Carboxypeptidase regulatory-like domain